MSAFAMVDTYDTQMVDFTDDVDVSMAVSSSDNWFHTGVHMEEDGHVRQQPAIVQHDPLEIDMTNYEETEEYEMADEQFHTDGHEPVDAEVYDTSIHTSPALFPAAVHPPHEIVLAVIPVAVTTSSYSNDHEPLISSVQDESSNGPAFFHPSESPEQQNNTMTFDLTANDSDTILTSIPTSPQQFQVNRDVLQSEPEIFSESADITNNGEEKNEENIHHDVSSVREPSEAETQGILIVGQPVHEEFPQRSEDEHNDGNHAAPATEGLIQQAEISQNTESQTVEDQQQTHDESNATDLEPPPPVLLSLHMTASEGDQPDFVLFNLPDLASSSHGEEPLVLLQHQSSLFYDPISTVFEAFRREEYFTHLEELSEAEMVLNAFDLQLVISEDNIYAREVSLHDLYAMHHGVGLPGHLRLSLQSIHPRFITRYTLLREQITTRLASVEVTNENEVKEGHQDHDNELENENFEQHETKVQSNEVQPAPEVQLSNKEEKSRDTQEDHSDEDALSGRHNEHEEENLYDVTDDDAEGEIDSTHEDADQENDEEGQTVFEHELQTVLADDTVDDDEDGGQVNTTGTLDADAVHIVDEYSQAPEEQTDESVDPPEIVEKALPNDEDQAYEDEVNEEDTNDFIHNDNDDEHVDGQEEDQDVSSSSAVYAVVLAQFNSHSTSSYSTDDAWEGDDLQVVDDDLEDGHFTQEDEFGELDEFEEDVSDETIDDHLALENSNVYEDPGDPEKTFAVRVGDQSKSADEKKSGTFSKSSSKRSIDDLQDIADENDSTLGSPGSKRNRVS